MSSPMMPPQGGAPPGGSNPMAAAQSPLNPGDAQLMKKTGQVNPEGTFGEFMEGSFGIKWDDPVKVAMQKMQAAAKNASPMGKINTMAGAGSGGPPPGPTNQVPGISKPMPQGRPMAAQGGLGSLMGG